MSDITPKPRTPQQSADFLAQSLNENTTALERVTKRQRLTMALIVVIFLIGGFVIKSNHDSDVNTCEATNEVRKQTDIKWEGVSDFLGKLGVGRDPDEVDEREFLVLLTEDLKQTDCSTIGYFG